MSSEEPYYRRGSKTRLRLNVSRKKRRCFPAKKRVNNVVSNNDNDNVNNDLQTYNVEISQNSSPSRVKNSEVEKCNELIFPNQHNFIEDQPNNTNIEAHNSTASAITTTINNSGPAKNISDDDNNNKNKAMEIEESGDYMSCFSPNDECTEKEHNITDDFEPLQIEGRRIINLNFFINSLMEMSDHSPQFGCSLQTMYIVKEEMRGFISTLHFKCRMCNIIYKIHTSNEETDDNINSNAVLGIMAIGCGFSHLEQVTSAMDVPCMTSRMYDKVHDKICSSWEEKCLEVMWQAAEEEKRLAVEAGEVSENGTPMITVVCDGSWAKRSYRSNYNSLSGAAAIVGYRTKKVLFMGIRNKFCSICKMSESNDSFKKAHACYKNWTGPSSSMEADILAEGFSKSLEMYGIIYSKMIADGDSNCYKKILDVHPYENTVVQKIECRNHLLRNYSRKIRELVKDTTAAPLILRQRIQKNQLRLRWAVSKAVNYRKNQAVPLNEKISLLKLDIGNSISHVFDEHKNCQKIGYFCDKPYSPSGTIMSDLKITGLYEKLESHNQYLMRHASSLIYDVDNNCVEQFNSIIAKFIGGKRVNYCKKRSYQARCAAAVISHNTGRPIYITRKHLSHGKSPGKYAKKIEMKNLRRRQNKTPTNARKKLTFSEESNNEVRKGYGDNCEKPDMNEEDLQIAKDIFLKKLVKSEEEIKKTELQTRDQRNSELWYLERRKRLTASRFGEVCRRRPTTSCKSLVESILYPKTFFSKATEHGIKNEDTAIKEVERITRNAIERCGLFIDSELPFLAATPDGLIGSRGIVEIKCPWSAVSMTPEEGISSRKITFWNGSEINTRHKWYYQVQGQLEITKKDYCVLAVWTPFGIKAETIFRNEEFWLTNMKKPLVDFYHDCMLPELVDSRKNRNMPIRDPPYIEEAIRTRGKKRKQPTQHPQE